ncbi:hypothetical protein D9757_009332 [Collybiopsis confluens]|uniref:Uncharacterized protein n=1 Tax=Collybiopsis confluens TaxID=2823264 RepID=A0A8H5M0C3_9AGAR|nr:hypothetical protein D9757_009332 [Collybiopsis confluens]
MDEIPLINKKRERLLVPKTELTVNVPVTVMEPGSDSSSSSLDGNLSSLSSRTGTSSSSSSIGDDPRNGVAQRYYPGLGETRTMPRTPAGSTKRQGNQSYPPHTPHTPGEGGEFNHNIHEGQTSCTYPFGPLHNTNDECDDNDDEIEFYDDDYGDYMDDWDERELTREEYMILLEEMRQAAEVSVCEGMMEQLELRDVFEKAVDEMTGVKPDPERGMGVKRRRSI